jgi:type IV fimbrial biogenesis protein FimT
VLLPAFPACTLPLSITVQGSAMHYLRGFTLHELIYTLAVLGVLTSLAVPSFAELQRNSQRTTAVNEFFHAVFLARSEAIKRGAVVSICKSIDGQTCAHSAKWSAGWIVFANLDRDEPPRVDANEPVLQFYPGWRHGDVHSNRSSFSFRPTTQGVVNGTIVFCDDRGPREARAIIISHTGRPRVATRDADNKPLNCS